jgi:pyruvate carboxylase
VRIGIKDCSRHLPPAAAVKTTIQEQETDLPVTLPRTDTNGNYR